MTRQVKEILSDGKNIIDEDGDVLPRHDFIRDDYSDEEFEEAARDQAILDSIVHYEEYLYFKSLVERGSHDPEVRRQHGVGACRQRKIDAVKQARIDYLHSQAVYILEDPSRIGVFSDEKQHEYDKGVALWLGFRTTVLDKADARGTTKELLEEKLERHQGSL